MSGINIAFTSTAYGPLWSPAVSSWLNVVAYTARHCEIQHLGKVGGAGVTDRQYTHMAENQLVKDFLDHPEATHLFMTEMDMVLPRDCIVRLLELDKDIASGVYFLRSAQPEGRGQPCLYKRPVARLSDRAKDANPYGQYPVTIFPTEEPFRAGASGLGCVLFTRRVFETMPYPWFDLSAEKYGSDMYFYKHATDYGFECWVDPRVRCGQIDYYQTTIEDWYWQLENNPDFGRAGYIIGREPQTNGAHA
ncbi:MAG TPA: hypothetical protein VEA38_00975 [Terriglobales bacterium]|nr:hypothetical protein [Terriglobales bacterium]